MTFQDLKRRQEKVLFTLCECRNDLKFYNITGILPNYAVDIYDLKNVISHYSNSLHNIRYRLDTKDYL